jgi:ferredoxin-NADP reductase
MANHAVKIIDAEYITPDVKRFIIEKPAGYKFIPGQATEVALNKEGWSGPSFARLRLPV